MTDQERIELADRILNTGDQTYKEACELLSEWLDKAFNVSMGAEAIFNASPTGELYHVHELRMASRIWALKAKEV